MVYQTLYRCNYAPNEGTSGKALDQMYYASVPVNLHPPVHPVLWYDADACYVRLE